MLSPKKSDFLQSRLSRLEGQELLDVWGAENQQILDPVSQGFLYHARMEMKQWIRTAREHARLTQEQLGEQIGVGKGNVSAWENGRHEASVAQIQKIAEVTGYPPMLAGNEKLVAVQEDRNIPPEGLLELISLYAEATAKGRELILESARSAPKARAIRRVVRGD